MDTKNDSRIAVLNPVIAKKLLHLGYKVIDLEPNLADRKKSIFIFEQTDQLESALNNLIEQRKLQKKLYEVETLKKNII